MSDTGTPEVGTIGWIDLTVNDAETVRDFYREVVGWKVGAVDMGGYQDFTMSTAEKEQMVAGVCHARGSNAALPPVWLIYITVADVDRSAEQVVRKGGKVRIPPRSMGGGRFCLIEDPAGAVSALFEPPPPKPSGM
jgi:predicted enzyme related to lactoylglutathione lyase